MNNPLISDKFHLPSEWEVDILDNFTNLIVDGTHFTPSYTENGIPFLRVTDIQEDKIDFTNLKFITIEEHNSLVKRCKPEKGDILYSKNGTIGIPKVVNWDWEFSIFVSLCLIKPQKNKLNSYFLKFILQSELIKWQIHRRAKQGTVTNLHLEEIRELEIPKIKLPRQRKIVRILTTVDNIIEKTESALKKYKAIKQGMMHDLFTRGIDVKTGKLRPCYEDAPELYNEAELRMIPKGWDIGVLNDYCSSFINGGTPSTKNTTYWQGNIPWITGADFLETFEIGLIRRKITNEAVKNSATHVIPKGNILLVTRTGVGKLAIAPTDIAISQDITGLILVTNKTIIDYFYYYFQILVEDFKKINQGTSINGIIRDDLISCPIHVPKKKEQTIIAAKLLSIDNRLRIEHRFLNKQKRLKQALMQDLLTGKKEVIPDPEDFNRE